jgi:DNA phosphorothioation-associated putative methyltransferase
VALAGKRVGFRTYFPADYPDLEAGTKAAIEQARTLASKNSVVSFNIVRIEQDQSEIALLNYPRLGLDPFPTLSSSWRVHLPTSFVTYRNYSQSLNPPILHRSELLLPDGHENKERLKTLTTECESLGLFSNPSIIGFKKQWEQLVADKGYALSGLSLVPVANVTEPEVDGAPDSYPLQPLSILRHRTALSRVTLSAPVQCLIRDGLLTTSSALFDYGCGRGDDIATLRMNGFSAEGWDPHYRPGAERISAQVVNLGFVINVIENLEERIEALERAFSLANQVLAVGVMLASSGPSTGGRCYRDGVVTTRGTFQKYFTQTELQQFLESVLDVDAYPAAPGICYVFKDRLLEQTYLLRKSGDHSRIARARLAAASKARPQQPRRTHTVTAAQSEEAVAYLARLWTTCLELGRSPEIEEYPDLETARRLFRTPNRAITAVLARNDTEALSRAEKGRSDDILVMLALQHFGRRRQFTELEDRLRRDIKTFFGSFRIADAKAHELLFSVQDTSVIAAACVQAASLGLGWLEAEHSLQLHTSLVPRLPAPLRVYIGCATALAGSLSSYDLVKAHIGSGKVTLMSFDDFPGTPLPRLLSRIKIRLRDQDLDTFEYGNEQPCPLLYNKSRYINEEFPCYAEQVAFDEALAKLRLVHLDGYGPPAAEFYQKLFEARREIDGFVLKRSSILPDLDSRCGITFTYRELIECGETWSKTRIHNAPKSPDTYNALYDLATEILDPVVDYFGAIKLTYGFASPALTKQIARNIAPKIDQHAACELDRNGRAICTRLGAAVDFLVEFEDMVEVASWISSNCAFDRLYLYGRDRPLHVSIGPQCSRECYLIRTAGDRRIPRRIQLG